MKKILFLLALSLAACSNKEVPQQQTTKETVVPNYDSLVGKQVLILEVDDWKDWSMWNEERTKVQGHIYAGETSSILVAKEIKGDLRYKVTNSKGEQGFVSAEVCEVK